MAAPRSTGSLGGPVKFPFRKIEPVVLDILRIALYQILYMERVPESAAVNEAVNQAKAMGRGHLVGFVNGILRQICRSKDLITFPDKANDAYQLSVRSIFISRMAGDEVGRGDGIRFYGTPP